MSKARKTLEQVLERTDGCVLRGSPDIGSPMPGQPPKKDYVLDCDVQEEIYWLIFGALESLGE